MSLAGEPISLRRISLIGFEPMSPVPKTGRIAHYPIGMMRLVRFELTAPTWKDGVLNHWHYRRLKNWQKATEGDRTHDHSLTRGAHCQHVLRWQCQKTSLFLNRCGRLVNNSSADYPVITKMHLFPISALIYYSRHIYHITAVKRESTPLRWLTTKTYYITQL